MRKYAKDRGVKGVFRNKVYVPLFLTIPLSLPPKQWDLTAILNDLPPDIPLVREGEGTFHNLPVLKRWYRFFRGGKLSPGRARRLINQADIVRPTYVAEKAALRCRVWSQDDSTKQLETSFLACLILGDGLELFHTGKPHARSSTGRCTWAMPDCKSSPRRRIMKESITLFCRISATAPSASRADRRQKIPNALGWSSKRSKNLSKL